MPAPFVWFDNIGGSKDSTASFLSELFGWNAQQMGPMTMLATPDGPFAGAVDPMPEVSGWVPYVEVEDLAAEAARATAAGAEIIASDLVGPAGTATFLRDPGGAPLAIWKRADSAA